jgi:hypothetical protein
LPDVTEVLAATINRAMMEAARTSETSVTFYQTAQLNNPKDSHLQTKDCIRRVTSLAR